MAAAAIPALISVEEYLHADYEPDMDYVDGVLEERNLGEMDHGALQRRLSNLLSRISDAIEDRTFVETRVQVSATRFRVPDICVLAEGYQDTRIIKTPPILCLEILSPEDRMVRVLRRANDFFAMGVPEIWIFDPEGRTAYRLLPSTTLQVVTGRITSLSNEISLDLNELFRTPRPSTP
jgi:Uma2 family endonuclease